MAEVKLVHVIKTFGKVKAIDDFTLHIKDGEFVILVGPSGCGKSTVLRSIAGLEEITSGDIYIGDRLVNEIHPKDRDIAMVFQNYALYPHMDVYENMAFSLRQKKIPKKDIDQKVRSSAKLLGIDELLERKPRQLSGGQRQRVALGRAIVRSPQVFLFDEPLSNLDAKLRIVMRAELLDLHQKLKTTSIYVTHDQVEAMTMGDRLVVMNQGRIQQLDTPQNLYDRPMNRFVAGFIGSPPMNFIECRLATEDGKLHAKTHALDFRIPEERAGKLGPYVGKEVV
ncbi:MAG: sn-glycerol-3-phosphate ABC transporter ATP-binding protein UgpC, partial [Desulfobacteraceae bacterium]